MDIRGNNARRTNVVRRVWRGQCGLEGIEVALISGLAIVLVLAVIPIVGGGIQSAIQALADLLADAGAGIN